MKTYKEFSERAYSSQIDEGVRTFLKGVIKKPLQKAATGAMNWFNKGKNTRIPNESKASWRKLFADDLSQRQHISADPKSAWNPVRGMPGYGSAKSVINPRIRAINTRRRSMGKPPLSMDKINPGGFQTGPTPIQREIIKRPIRALKGLTNN